MSLRKPGSSPSSSLSLPKLLPHLHNSTVWAANFAMKPHAVISRESDSALRDEAKAHGVGIAPREKSRPRRGANGGSMKIGVAQSLLRDPIEHRRIHRAAECGRRAEADVVAKDHEDVGSTFRGLERLRPVLR